MEPRSKEDRNQERKKFIEHNLRVEEILFRAITTLAEDSAVTATTATAMATVAKALVEVQKRIL